MGFQENKSITEWNCISTIRTSQVEVSFLFKGGQLDYGQQSTKYVSR